MLECELLDLRVVERVVDLVLGSYVPRLLGRDGVGCQHVLDNLLGRDLCTVVVLIDGKDKSQGKDTVKMFDELLVRDAGCVVHLGNDEEFVEADEE